MQIKSGRWNWRAPHTSEIQIESEDGIREVQPNKNWQLKKDLEKVEMKLEKYNQTKKKKKNSTKVLELLDFRTY